MTPTAEPSSLPAFIAECLSLPRAVALAERRGRTEHALSSGAVHRRAAAVAAALRARRIARGDRVAILAENRVDWLVADYGILYAGATVVPMFATLAQDQIAYILRDSQSKLVFAGSPTAAAHVRALPDAPHVVEFDAVGDDGLDAFVRSGTAAQDADSDALMRVWSEIARDDLAVLIYTSGTTGTPKGVMLSHGNLLADVRNAFDPQDSALRPDDVALSVLPFAHVYEHTDALGYLYNHVTHYVTVPDRLIDDLRAVRPTYAAFVPRIFERLLAAIVGNAAKAGGLQARLVPWALETGTAYERARREGGLTPLLQLQFALARSLVLRKIAPRLGLDRIRCVVSGSAPLHRDTAYALAGIGIEVFEGYGLTETSPVVTVNRPGDNVLGTVGAPIRGVEVRIADDGEIQVRGPNVMLGYYNVPPDEQPFTPDGWFCTGDIGAFRGTHLTITDRKRELFKTSGGKWISPARIESAIKRSVYIGQVVAYGEGRAHPAALVAPNWMLLRHELGIADDTPTATMAADPRVERCVLAEVEAQTRDLAPFEQVHRVAILPRDLTIEDGELSPTLKIKRRVVEQRYAALAASAYDSFPVGRTAARTSS